MEIQIPIDVLVRTRRVQPEISPLDRFIIVTLPARLKDGLALPAIAAPLFIISHPPLVIEQCKAGIIGSFPALNARPASQLPTIITCKRRCGDSFAFVSSSTHLYLELDCEDDETRCGVAAKDERALAS